MKKLNRYSVSYGGDIYLDDNGDYCWSDQVEELEDENIALQKENEFLKHKVEEYRKIALEQTK